MKRLVDILISSLVLFFSLPLLLPVMFLIYRQDGFSPFYVAPRVGKKGKLFKMIKLRSMVKNADKSGVDSTSAADPRITPIGKFVRKTKLDEIPQLLNVLKGEMSLVGPRPNVARETALYTTEEMELLSVRPGITDIASIVFADENDILKDSADPDLDYNQRIRPWKSRLGILYIRNQSFSLDMKLMFLTALNGFSREDALKAVNNILSQLHVDGRLSDVAKRSEPLYAFPPPGASEIVMSRA